MVEHEDDDYEGNDNDDHGDDDGLMMIPNWILIIVLIRMILPTAPYLQNDTKSQHQKQILRSILNTFASFYD